MQNVWTCVLYTVNPYLTNPTSTVSHELVLIIFNHV